MAANATVHETSAPHLVEEGDDSDSNMMVVDDGDSSACSSDIEEIAGGTSRPPPSLVLPTEEEEAEAFRRGVAMLNDSDSLLNVFCAHLPPGAQLSARHEAELKRDYLSHDISREDLEVDEKRAAREIQLKEIVRKVWSNMIEKHGTEKIGECPPNTYYAYPRYYTKPLTKTPIPKPREVRNYARGNGVQHWSITSKPQTDSVPAISAGDTQATAAPSASAAPKAAAKKAKNLVHVVQYRVIFATEKPDPKRPGHIITKLGVYCAHKVSPNVCPDCNTRNNFISSNADARLLETAKVRRCPVCGVNDGPCPHPMAVPSPIGDKMIPAGRICLWSVPGLTIYKLLVRKSSASGRDSAYYCQHGAISPRCKMCRLFFTELTEYCRSGGEATRPFVEKPTDHAKLKRAKAAARAKAKEASSDGDPVAFYGEQYVKEAETAKSKKKKKKEKKKKSAPEDDEDGEEPEAEEAEEELTLDQALTAALSHIYGDEEDEDEEEEDEEEDGDDDEEDEDDEDEEMEEEEEEEAADAEAEEVQSPTPEDGSARREQGDGVRGRLAGSKRPAPVAMRSSAPAHNTYLVTTLINGLRTSDLMSMNGASTDEMRQAIKYRITLLDDLQASYAHMPY